MTFRGKSAYMRRQARITAAIENYIRERDEFNVIEVGKGTGISKCTIRVYMIRMEKSGTIHKAAERTHNNYGSSSAVWAKGARPPEVIAAPVADDEDDDEPMQKTVTHWAHGMAKRYCMGRVI